MKRLVVTFFLSTTVAVAQGGLPWGQAVSVPALANQAGVAMFYVSSYSWVGTHTDYDMARQAADAYLTAHPDIRTYLVLSPTATETCDAVPLPSIPLGNRISTTVSIVGYGSNVSSIIKRSGCAPSRSTLDLQGSATGSVFNAMYQGFEVNANHIDSAACGFYGVSKSTFLDVSCANAVPGADHEVEFGNLNPRSIGRVYDVAIYNLKSFDNVGVGAGAMLAPVWTTGGLTSVIVVSGGTARYTQQYARAQVVGPDLSSCTIVPQLKPIVSNLTHVNFDNVPMVNYGYVTGATVTNAGSCSRTGRLYILIQDGVPVKYGMKFSNMQMSHAWNLESTSSSTYGEAWLAKSGSNTIIGEHTYTNQAVQIAEYASGNKHVNAFFDGPGEYGAAIYGSSGGFANSIFSWDSTTYIASSGYYFGGAAGSYREWEIQNSQCTNSTPNFISITTVEGPLMGTDPAPSGVTFNDIERCDGSNAVDWATQVGSQQ